MGSVAVESGGIGWEDLEGPDMVICCVYLIDGRNQRAWLIFIRCAYDISFESTLPCNFMPMKACNSHFIREFTGTLL